MKNLKIKNGAIMPAIGTEIEIVKGLGKMVQGKLNGALLGTVSGANNSELPWSTAPFTVTVKAIDELEGILSFELEGERETAKVSSSSYEEEIKRIVDEGIRPEETVRAVISQLEEAKISTEMIQWVLAHTQKWEGIVQQGVMSPYVSPSGENIIGRCIRKMAKGISLIFAGPASTGKTYCASYLAWLLGMPYYRQNYSRETDKDALLGVRSTDNSAAEKLTKELAEAYVKGDDVAKAEFALYSAQAASVKLVQEESSLHKAVVNGGVYIADEFNLAQPGLLKGVFNPILDRTTSVIEMDGYGKTKVSDEFLFIACINEGAKYGGKEIEKSLSTRLSWINFPTPSANDIEGILKGKFNEEELKHINPTHFKACAMFYSKLQEAVKDGSQGLSEDAVNIRGMVSAIKSANVFSDGSLADELYDSVIRGLPEAEREPVFKIMKKFVV